MNDVEICPICRKPYKNQNIKVKYHTAYYPNGEYIYACRACNHAEWLSRQWKRYLIKPWQWWRIKLVKKFAKDNPHFS